jgi:hypothetical protein
MAQEQAVTAETPKPAPNLTGNEEFKDETLEVEGEEAVEPEAKEAAEEPAAEEEPAKERKRRGPKRYSALTHERDEARNYAQQLEQELQRERARSLDFESKAKEASTVAMQSYAAKAEADLRDARTFHSSAIESQDANKITEAAERLASAKSAMDDVEAWKKTEKAKADAPKPQPQQQQQQQPIQDLPPEIKGWVIENRYFDAVARDDSGNIMVDRSGRPMQNPDFDEEMHVEATMYATKLERQINSGKLNFKVASPQYFQAVEKHMRSEFPDYFNGGGEAESEAEEEAPVRRASPVAGPTRTVSGNGAQKPSHKINLSADEVRFVTRMVENGGGPKYPSGHPNAFKPMTLTDAKISFDRQKKAQAANR